MRAKMGEETGCRKEALGKAVCVCVCVCVRAHTRTRVEAVCMCACARVCLKVRGCEVRQGGGKLERGTGREGFSGGAK